MTTASGQAWSGRQLLVTQRVRDRRSALGLTQKQVVTRLSRFGIRTTNRALSSLEHGAGVDVVKLPELAAALDCTVTYLLGLTSDPHRWEPDGSPTPTVVNTNREQGQYPGAQPYSCILGLDVSDRNLGVVGDRNRN